MILTKSDLRDFISEEMKLYGLNSKNAFIKAFILKETSYYRWKFQYFLRKSEYHKNNKGFRNRFLYLYYHRKKNKLGLILGFDISENTFDCGLVIFHSGYVVVNPKARIGKNCHLVGDICIGNKNKAGGVPIIGDNLIMGTGSSVIGDVYLGNNITIAAGAVVTKSFNHSSTIDGANVDRRLILAGIPARISVTGQEK